VGTVSFFAMKGGNTWREGFTMATEKDLRQIVAACRTHGVQFCFAMHPVVRAPRPIDYHSEEDVETLWRRYAWVQALGVKWFALCLDDISAKDPEGQAKLVRAIWKRLRAADPGAQVVFCPTEYTGGGGGAYIATMARELPEDVYVFWTGAHMRSSAIPREHAEGFKRHIKRRIIIWDNYPVNGGAPYLRLGPIIGRDADLGEVVDGYMSNVMVQSEINRIPLLTIADYTYNPWDYDPARSVGQAILHLAETPAQRRALKDVVEMYPGNLFVPWMQGLNNAVQLHFRQVSEIPHARYAAEALLRHHASVIDRLEAEFPGRFEGARKIMETNLDAMSASFESRYGAEPYLGPGPRRR
jgi:hypothetical protein